MSRVFMALSMSCAIMLCSAAVQAGVPTDADVKAAVEKFSKARDELRSAKDYSAASYQKASEQALAGIDISQMTLDQIVMLIDNSVYIRGSVGEALSTRLKTLAADKSRQGALAGLIALSVDMPADEAAQSDLLTIVLKHPALPEVMRDGSGWKHATALGNAKQEVLRSNLPTLIGWHEYLPTPIDIAQLSRIVSLYSEMVDANQSGDMKPFEPFRRKLLDAAEKIIAEEASKKSEKDDGGRPSFAVRVRDKLNGAYMRGELIDHAAPTISFQWVSGDRKLKSPADLKGKVVVIDFWATWCGPCVASFPDVHKLADHYKGYPVEIIGVTSLQGRHYPGGGAAPIDCKDDPTKEMNLMSEFIKEKDITWTIAFGTQDVFNPDYGVNGIPHVAIIDPDGKVRFNGLHPSSPMEKKTAMIDGLLTEFKLPIPTAQSTDETPKAKE